MPWQLERIYNHGEGIYRITDQSDPTFPAGALWDCLNMVYAAESDNPESMRGAVRIGSTDMGGAVSGLFDYGDGTRLVATATDGKIYQYTGGDFAAESGARASGNDTTETTRWNAVTFYGQTTSTELLVLANGVDAPAKYNGTDVTDLGGSPPATGNFPETFVGRLWLASGDTLYYSAVDDCEDWSTAGGGGNIVIARGKDGDITGIMEHANVLLVFKKNSIYRVRPGSSFASTDVLQVSQNIGCLSARTLQQAGPEGAENLTLASTQGQEMIAATDTSAGVAVRNISRWPKAVLEFRNEAQMDVSWSLFNLNRRELYFYYPTQTNTIPKEGIIGNFARSRKPPRWTRMDRANLTAATMFKDSGTRRVQYVGDSDGRVYQMHIESATDWAGSPYTSRIITSYRTQKAIERQKRYGWSFLDVQTEADYNVDVYQVLMRRSLTAASNISSLGITGVESGWGDGTWGDAVWGGVAYAGEKIRPIEAQRGAGLAHIISSTRWFRLNSEVVAYNYLRDTIVA